MHKISHIRPNYPNSFTGYFISGFQQKSNKSCQKAEIQSEESKGYTRNKIVTEMKNAFDKFNNSLDRAKEIISGLEDISIEVSKIEMQKQQQNENMELNIQEPWYHYKRCNISDKGLVSKRHKEVS